MEFATARAFANARPDLPSGPVAVVLCESPRQANTTVARVAEQGAGAIIVVGDAGEVDTGKAALVRIAEDPGRHAYRVLNAVLTALTDRWVLWMWGGEYLVFPFCETRTLSELTSFLQDERRKVMCTYTLDLYGIDMPRPGQAPWQADLSFDRIGYQPFPDGDNGLNLYGGLAWRFEELSPGDMHQLTRPSLVRVQRGATLDRNWRFNDPDLDSVSCPWHHSPTGAIMSLRRTWRIMAHAGFTDVAGDLMWQGSTRFDWTSRQLLELGMIEPGQWF